MIEMSTKDKLQIASLLGEIQTLSYMINSFTEYCVFVRYAGHVDKIEIDIASSKENYNERLVNTNASVDHATYYKNIERGNIEAVMINLTKIKYQLKKILRDHKIDYSKLNYEIEEVRHYKLI